MTVPRSAAQVLSEHVTLEMECIDRMYLNLYVPQLQRDLGVVGFFRARGCQFASGALMEPITRAFVAAILRFVDEQGVDLVRFEKGQRKDDVALDYLSRFDGDEGVLFVGVAQEKAQVWTTRKQRNPVTGASYPWLVRDTRVVNHYYVYAVDADFGPFFIKFCSYFPYTGKLCLNGNVRHEAPSIRAEVKGLRRWAVAAAWLKLGAARPRRRAGGWEQPRQRRDGLASPDGPGPASKTGRRTREISVNAPQVKTPAQIWRIGAGTQRTPTARRATPTPGVAVGGGGHGEGLRRTRGEAAGAQLAASPDDRWMVNVGTAGCCPPCRPARAAAGRHVVC